jgi:UDP-N-acetylmuramoylalanine--D-glutamate ligase
VRYKNQNIAVLGAGLSGSAAGLLLRSEGAHVTMLDSAEEKNLLKSTIDNLRAQDVRVICGAAADEDSSTYQMAVLSPGIDPASRLVRNFLSRGIDIIGELELKRHRASFDALVIQETYLRTREVTALSRHVAGAPQSG